MFFTWLGCFWLAGGCLLAVFSGELEEDEWQDLVLDRCAEELELLLEVW